MCYFSLEFHICLIKAINLLGRKGRQLILMLINSGDSMPRCVSSGFLNRELVHRLASLFLPHAPVRVNRVRAPLYPVFTVV